MQIEEHQIRDALKNAVLENKITQGPMDRFVGVETLDSGRKRIHINSENLNLHQKMQIERAMSTSFEDVSVNFKKPGSAKYHSPKGLKRPGKAKKTIPGVKRVLAVASGKGGVGKSTISTNLAVGLRNLGMSVGLLDADLYGPSLPTMLGLNQAPNVTQQKLDPIVSHGVHCMSSGFLADEHNPVIWRGPMISKAFEQFLFDVNWPELDVLVLDLPPGTGDIQMTLLETLDDVQAVVVTTPQEVALQDAHRALAMFKKAETPVLGIVENMAFHQCSACGHKDPIFGQGGGMSLALSREIECLGRVPLDIQVRKCGDYGQPVVMDENLPVSKVMQDICQNVKQGLEKLDPKGV